MTFGIANNVWLIATGVVLFVLSLAIVNRFELQRRDPLQLVLTNNAHRLPMLAVIALVIAGGAMVYYGMRS